LTDQPDLRHPYLTSQLIAYIGNKRALLRFLHEILREVEGCVAAESARKGEVTFLDPFAGSGAVSRLARTMGFSVAANDWEPYSFVINSCHLGLSPRLLADLFLSFGGMDGVLRELNSLPPPSESERYIARHYAPQATKTADWRTERLFYTTENALKIDAIRQRIEEMYPGDPANPADRARKAALVAPLLYEAATHTNTSGVFKACHRGFGGHGRDALTRIMAPISLEMPVLVESGAPSKVACEDAVKFLSARAADICYLDPPYAVHQYGSNYFMLNSIALWDQPSVSEERGPDGRLLKKAGIREDWVRTRSRFCYPSTALAALRDVVQAADCRYLVVSYSNEGLIGLEELCELLSETGKLSVRSTGYVKYPGGKQSLGRRTNNTELALIVDRRTGPRPAGAVASRTREVLREVAVSQLLGRAFDPECIRRSFSTVSEGIIIETGGESHLLAMRHHWRFAPGARAPRFPNASEADRFIERLTECEVADVQEEIEILVRVIGAEQEGAEKRRLVRVMLKLFNKLAHRKYAREFAEALAVLQRLATKLGDPEELRAGLARVVDTAARRKR
jgi:adenine-specific DNA-methyltransferase